MSKNMFENIGTHSISAISGILPDHEQSFITDFFSGNKLKTGEQDEESMKKIEYTIKVNAPQTEYEQIKNMAQTPDKKSQPDQNAGDQQLHQAAIIPEEFPLKETTTGYEVKRELYSQSEILEAFKIIDINKDDFITEEDIIFFLEYIKEPYTHDEVREMIQMVSLDKEKVGYQDFKKIGKGVIIPFAGFKVPDKKIKEKERIFENIKESDLINLPTPQMLLQAERNQITSKTNFQQEKLKKLQKINRAQKNSIQNEENDFAFIQKILQLRSIEQLQQRRQLFNSIPMLNITQAMKNYKNYEDKYISYEQIAGILQITEKQAKILYGSKQVSSKFVIMEAIAHSRLKPLHRLELELSMLSKKKTIKFKQWLHIMQFLMGRDGSQGTIKKKLLALMKHKRIDIEAAIDKHYAVQLIGMDKVAFYF